MKEPTGWFGSCKPLRARRTESATAWMASAWPTTRSPIRSSMWTSFWRSPSSILATGMPVHAATTSAMFSSVTSSCNSRLVCPDCFNDSCISASFFSRPGIVSYRICAAWLRSPSRSAFSCSRCASSSWLLTMLAALMDAFSSCQLVFNALVSSFSLARVSSSLARRFLLAASFSFFNAVRSISNCMICRSSWSISVGIESSSIRSRAAASSMRSIALSGRKRSVMYRWERVVADTSAVSWMRMPWCTS